MALLGLSVRRIYRQQKSLHDKTTVAWSAEALMVIASHATMRHPWSDFIPRRTLTADQADDLL